MMKYIYLLVITILLGTSSMAHVKLNNPTGGEFFSPGDTVNIQWQELATHATENFDLFFSPDGGVTWDVILLNIDPVAFRCGVSDMLADEEQFIEVDGQYYRVDDIETMIEELS